MGSNRNRSYIHLLHGIAVAVLARNGGGDAEVEHVPVSRTPFIKLEIGEARLRHDDDLEQLYEACEVVRREIVIALREHGFFSFAGQAMDEQTDGSALRYSTFVKKGDDGYRVIEISEPRAESRPSVQIDFTDVERESDLSFYRKRGYRPRDAKMQFLTRFGELQHNYLWRETGRESAVLSLLSALPFRLSSEGLSSLRRNDPERASRIIKAIASQTLRSEEDLIRLVVDDVELAPSGMVR